MLISRLRDLTQISARNGFSILVSYSLNKVCLQIGGNQASGSGRARRDAAARAMQGWHSQRLLGNGEVGDPIIKVYNIVC